MRFLVKMTFCVPFSYRAFLSFFALLFSVNIFSQSTIVSGIVRDAKNGEPLAFAVVYFSGDITTGVTTTETGSFELITSNPAFKKVTVSYLGYEDKTISITPGANQQLQFLMSSSDNELNEIIVRASRKTVKDTPAIALYRRVVNAKANYDLGQFQYYKYTDYTKTEFDLFNPKKRWINAKILKPFRFIFENMDTSKRGIPYLPFMLRERIEMFAKRKDPEKSKSILLGEKTSGVDDVNTDVTNNFVLPDMNIFDNVYEIAEKSFLSPFAKGALTSYKYFLEDSVVVDGRKSYLLQFAPRRKQDLCFTGEAWVDSTTAAIKTFEVYLLDQANLNFVTDFQIRQDFTQFDTLWIKTYEQSEVSLNVVEVKKRKNKQTGIRILKTLNRGNLSINQELPDSLFNGEKVEINPKAYKRDKLFWENERLMDLNSTEYNIYTMMDRLKAMPLYRHLEWWGHTFATGYMRTGPLELGKWTQCFSRNDIEGERFRFGFKLNRKKLGDKFKMDVYGAYGTKDMLFKYHIGGSMNLKRVNNKWHQVGASYRYDWSDFNASTPWLAYDNILISLFRKSPINNLFLLRQGRIYYEREWLPGWTTHFSSNHRTIYSWPGYYSFDSAEGDTVINGQDKFEILEFRFTTGYGLGIKFAERGGQRVGMNFSKPYASLEYIYSPKNILGSDYNYQLLELGLRQDVKSRFGKFRYNIKAGKLFGTVPYPLLKIYSGNESYIFNRYNYNMMNELEYASDSWVQFYVAQEFQGDLFNMIPLIKRMKLRSNVAFKAINGRMSSANASYLVQSNGLKGLDEWYAEASVGIANILKVFQCHFIWRLTQRDLPTSPKFGIKLYVSPSF